MFIFGGVCGSFSKDEWVFWEFLVITYFKLKKLQYANKPIFIYKLSNNCIIKKKKKKKKGSVILNIILLLIIKNYLSFDSK